MYVWLILPVSGHFESYQGYREFRAGLLIAYCQSAKLLKPERRIVVGVATDPPGSNGGSEDMIYIDTYTWSEDDYAEARDVREKLGLFKEANVIEKSERHYQYPVERKSTDNRAKRQEEKKEKRKETIRRAQGERTGAENDLTSASTGPIFRCAPNRPVMRALADFIIRGRNEGRIRNSREVIEFESG